MRTRTLFAGAAVAWLAVLGFGACDGAGGNEELLQDPCVRDEISFSDDLPDGEECFNIGYAGCPGFASDCVHYCAFDVCQASPCTSDDACIAAFDATYECAAYVVGDVDYGEWCRVSDCPKGTLGCPCRDGACGGDPYGGGLMTCESGTCESSCPWECREGTSVCCGGAFCGGDCVGSPCC